jgi:hypothetical protein
VIQLWCSPPNLSPVRRLIPWPDSQSGELRRPLAWRLASQASCPAEWLGCRSERSTACHAQSRRHPSHRPSPPGFGWLAYVRLARTAGQGGYPASAFAGVPAPPAAAIPPKATVASGACLLPRPEHRRPALQQPRRRRLEAGGLRRLAVHGHQAYLDHTSLELDSSSTDVVWKMSELRGRSWPRLSCLATLALRWPDEGLPQVP